MSAYKSALKALGGRAFLAKATPEQKARLESLKGMDAIAKIMAVKSQPPNTKIENVNFSRPSINSGLMERGFKTLKDVANASENEIAKCRWIGKLALAEIREVLKISGFKIPNKICHACHQEITIKNEHPRPAEGR